MLITRNPSLLIKDYGMLMSNYKFLDFSNTNSIEPFLRIEKMLMYSSFPKAESNKTNDSLAFFLSCMQIFYKSTYNQMHKPFGVVYNQNTNVVSESI